MDVSRGSACEYHGNFTMNLIIKEMLTHGWTKASLPQTSLYKTAKTALIRHKVSETLQTHLSLSHSCFLCVSLCPLLCQTHTHTLSSEPGSLLGCWLLTQGGLIAELNDRWNTSVCFESWRTVKSRSTHTQSSYTCPLIRGHSCRWMSWNFTVQTEHFHHLFFILKTNKTFDVPLCTGYSK